MGKFQMLASDCFVDAYLDRVSAECSPVLQMLSRERTIEVSAAMQ